MPQQAMIELNCQPKGFFIGRDNHSDGYSKIMDSIAGIFAFHKSNINGSPVFDDVREEGGVNAAFYENEETVFAAPEQTKKFKKAHRLIVLSADSPDKTYLLNRSKMMIGRDKSSHIRIDDKSVSLFHSMICIKANKCVLKDLNSKNGTQVNGHRVLDSYRLRDGDRIKIGSTLFTFIHGDPGRAFGARKPIRNNRIMTGGLVFLSVFILSIFIFLNQLKAGDSRPASSIEPQEQQVHQPPVNKNMTHSTKLSMAQQLSSPANAKPVSLDQKGQQLVAKALQYYINGEIALSSKMLDKVLQLNLPNDSTLKTNALVIKDKIAMTCNLYNEGLKQYKENDMGQALKTWSHALKTDQVIAGPASSYFANQVAVYTADILYRMARESYDKGNNAKAQELCSQTFRVQENHEGCIAIMNAL